MKKKSSKCVLTRKRSSVARDICHVVGQNRCKIGDQFNYNIPAFKIVGQGQLYQCIHCEESFYDDKDVKEHLGLIHSDFHFFCEFCAGYFSNERLLKRHGNAFLHNCEHCDYSTDRFAQFRLHCHRIHKIDLKPKFETTASYDKAYECQVCGYQVLLLHVYRNHMKTVHNETYD